MEQTEFAGWARGTDIDIRQEKLATGEQVTMSKLCWSEEGVEDALRYADKMSG